MIIGDRYMISNGKSVRISNNCILIKNRISNNCIFIKIKQVRNVSIMNFHVLCCVTFMHAYSDYWRHKEDTYNYQASCSLNSSIRWKEDHAKSKNVFIIYFHVLSSAFCVRMNIYLQLHQTDQSWNNASCPVLHLERCHHRDHWRDAGSRVKK